jgi:CRP-like cAMP-binding protein
MPRDAHDPQSMIEREIFLRSMSLGRFTGTRQLGRAMHDVFFEAGSVIYKEGSPADDLYFVVRGTVALTKPGEPPWEFGPRSVVGIIDADQNRPHRRTAVALTDVEALKLSSEDRLEVLEDNFEQARSLILFTSDAVHQLALTLPSGGFSEPEPTEQEIEPEELPLVERVLTLRDVPAFRKASIQALVSLAPVAEESRVRAGETLFRVGEVTGVFYVVARGMVELERQAPRISARFGPASIVGGSAAFGDVERSYAARAIQDSVLLRIPEEDFFDVMEDHFDLARSVFAYIAAEREAVMEAITLRKIIESKSAAE